MTSQNYLEKNLEKNLNTLINARTELELRLQSELGVYLNKSILTIDLQNQDNFWIADVIVNSNRGFKASKRKDQDLENLICQVIADLKIQFEITNFHHKNEIFHFDRQQEFDHYSQILNNTPDKDQVLLKVLVVDDDPTALLLLEKSLQAKGCTVDLTSDPEKAMEQLVSDSYDLVILDWGLPYMSGYDFLKKVDKILATKNQGNFDAKSIPLVICSSKSADEIDLPLVENFNFCQYWDKTQPFSTVISSIEAAIKNASRHKMK